VAEGPWRVWAVALLRSFERLGNLWCGGKDLLRRVEKLGSVGIAGVLPPTALVAVQMVKFVPFAPSSGLYLPHNEGVWASYLRGGTWI
jgi:hypothetical protein